MSIPNFKSIDDYKEFVNLFRERWEVKLELLNCVKDDMYPGYKWDALQPKTLETINDITQSLLYDVEYTFKVSYPDYRDEEDELFIPRKSFKENVTEALKEALESHQNNDSLP